MAEVASKVRRRDRLARLLRRRSIPAALILLAFAGLYAAAFRFQDWLADRGYREVAAEADRVDPGWRLDDLMAGLEKLPESANSAVAVESIAGRLPSTWPGGVLYDYTFLDAGRPELRLDPARLVEIRKVHDLASKFADDARSLSGLPKGQYRGRRPGVERLEQVAGLNALRDISFPYAEEVRRVALLLWLDGLIAVEEGRFEAAIVDVRAMIHAGRSIGDYPKLSAQMARQGASLMAVSLLDRILSQGEIGGDSRASIQALLEDEAKHPSAMISLRGERAIIDDFLQDIRSGNADVGAIPGFLDYPWPDRAFSGRSSLRDNQADLLRFHTRTVEIGKMPEEARIPAMKELNGEWSRAAANWGMMQRSGKLAERLLFGRSVGIPLWFGGFQATIRVATASVAAERYRLARGRWPESPEVLIPGWLAAIPTDPLAKGPIKFRGFPDGILFYSTGYDGVDDGGKIQGSPRMATGFDLGFRLRDVAKRRSPSKDAQVDED